MKRASPLYCAKVNDQIKGTYSLALSRFNVMKKMLATLIYVNSARHVRRRAEHLLSMYCACVGVHVLFVYHSFGCIDYRLSIFFRIE